MIKCIVSDMDGTMLNEEVEVTEATVQAIKKAQESGITFLIATGRSYEGGYPLANEKGIVCPYIANNGARTYDEKGNHLKEYGLEKAVARQAIEVFKTHDLDFHVFTNVGGFSDNKERRIESSIAYYRSINKDMTREEAEKKARERVNNSEWISFIDHYDEILEDPSHFIASVRAQSTNEGIDLSAVREELKAIIPAASITGSSSTTIEVTHPEAHKGNAVANYAKQNGLTKEEVMTIGDNYNDVSMIEWAGHGVAMENAIPEVKEVAKWVTSSNAENGVAEIITRVLNGKIK